MGRDHEVRRGRPEGFDRDHVIGRAVAAFWATGYDQTSLSTLEAETGVDRSTLYNSFGGKAGLYRSAADAYVDDVVSIMCAPLRTTDDGLEAIHGFLDQLDAVTTSDEYPTGCFVVNALPSPSHDRAATDRYLADLGEAFDAALGRAGLGDTDLAARRDVLVGLVVGVNAVAHHDVAAARSMIDGARALVRDWERERTG